MPEKIIITGATGLVGQRLTRTFLEQGCIVYAVTRSDKKVKEVFGQDVAPLVWGDEVAKWNRALKGARAVIHLAGESVGAGFWTEAKKKEILESRVKTGNLLTQAVSRLDDKPEFIIQASAIGYYSAATAAAQNESSPGGTGFLSQVAQAAEEALAPVEKLGIKRVVTRFGIVLAKEGGMLPQIIKPFKLFMGVIPGSGKQWFSWIAIDDLVRAVEFILKQEGPRPVYNLVSPNPCRMQELFDALGRVFPTAFSLKIPKQVIGIVGGEKGKELVLSDIRVVPQALLAAAFKFKFPKIDLAIKHIFSR